MTARAGSVGDTGGAAMTVRGRSGVNSTLLRQDRFARAAWSRLAEPGDPRAAELVSRLGPVGALGLVLDGADEAVAAYLGRAEQLDVERDLEIGARYGARIVCPGDDDWPRGLDDLAVPPYCLWVRGPAPLEELATRSVSVVGARASTAYGEHVATDFGAGLADRGYTVVSGAAFGIDAAAHRGALAVGGSTIAVLAGGVERPYPRAHSTLIEHVARSGAVLAEVAPGCAPTRSRFLQRNRLIATMTLGTVVVEAGLRSGSLNTARCAAEHGRPVGVVPGQITSMSSAGCHQARRDGYAELVTDVAEIVDLLGAIGVDAAPRRSAPVLPEDSLDPDARHVLGALPRRKGASLSVLARCAGMAETTVLSCLGRLEVIGLATREGEVWRQRARPCQ